MTQEENVFRSFDGEGWQTAVDDLKAYGVEMRSGAWSWRKFIITDHKTGMGYLQGPLNALVRTGDEFSLSVWRPMGVRPDNLTPAGFRVALLTWGEYLDMNPEDIEDLMIRKYSSAIVEGGHAEG